jgi:uncharacterized membrane protein
MTQQKIKELNSSLNSELSFGSSLSDVYVLSASQRPELICATLATLHAFLSWIHVLEKIFSGESCYLGRYGCIAAKISTGDKRLTMEGEMLHKRLLMTVWCHARKESPTL